MGEGAHLRSVEAPIFRREGPGGERGPPQGQMDNDEPEFIKTLIGTRVSGSKPRQATWKSKALPMALANHDTAGDVLAGYTAAASAMSRANDVTRVWARAIPSHRARVLDRPVRGRRAAAARPPPTARTSSMKNVHRSHEINSFDF
jgi:hypothetical protein